MNEFFGNSDVRFGLASILAKMPHTKDNQRILTTLVLKTVSGSIIGNHVLGCDCADDGGVRIIINDPRWIREIERVSDIIIHRMNRIYKQLECHDYNVSYLELCVKSKTPKKKTKSSGDAMNPVPDEIHNVIETLPEKVKLSFSDWYKKVARNH